MKKSRIVKIFLLYLLCIVAAYFLFFEQYYNLDFFDTYDKAVSEFGESLVEFNPFSAFRIYTSKGRFFTLFRYLAEFILYQFGVDLTHHQWVLVLLGMIPLALGATVLFELCIKKVLVKNNVIAFVTVILGVVNPSFAEILDYHCYHYCWAFFFICLSIKYFFDRKFLWALLWNFVSLGLYQSFYSVFLVYIISFVFIRGIGKIEKKDCFDILMGFFIDAVSVGSSVVLTKLGMALYGIERGNGISVPSITVFFERILRVIPRYGLNILTGAGILPTGLIPCVWLVLTIISSVFAYKMYSRTGLTVYLVYNGIIFSLPIAVTLFEPTPYVPPRILSAMYSGIGMLYLTSYVYTEGQEKEYVRLLKAISGTLFVCIYIMYLSVISYSADVHTANAIEKGIAQTVEREIESYERETGITVENIAVYHYRDEGRPAFDKSHFFFFGPYYYIQHLILEAKWSDVSTINYFNNTGYERFDMTEDQREAYFKDFIPKELSSFNPDRQMVFDGDTLYWVVY